ncbi:AAA family ATPase [Alicyclobacillus sendaiensis]|uniref:AAA family ATPase n=1 Tax=Alicyclobacillus sendaiensis TaxID=192387 RepID=UPI0026F41EAB|nr:MoxR family ATPase [Alicyclobacillus sendaiensis]
MSPTFARLRDAISSVVYGHDDAVDLVLCALVAGGHVLIEDVPGVGKTTLAMAVARLLGLALSRVQCTSDLLPADILGYAVYDKERSAVEVRKGPIFSEMVLVDELNRASPRAQSAFLEAMEEGSVTLDAQRYPLPQPFWVLATQNPRQFEGTYPLPESELDRFLMCVELGYPSMEDEIRMLASGGGQVQLSRLQPVATAADVLWWQREADQIYVDPAILRYAVLLARALRDHPRAPMGPSPRALLALIRAAKARAYIWGRTYVVPDDVRLLARPVWRHRLRPNPDSWIENSSDDILEEVLNQIPAPKLGDRR